MKETKSAGVSRIIALALIGLLSAVVWGLATVMPSDAEMAASSARREVEMNRREADVVCGAGRGIDDPACAKSVAGSRKASNDAFVDTMMLVAVL